MTIFPRRVRCPRVLTLSLLLGGGGLSSCDGQDDDVTWTGSPGTGGGAMGGVGGMGGDYEPENPPYCGGPIQSANWEGFLFSAVSEQSEIAPDTFGTCPPCVSGRLAPGTSEWAAIGWNIAQEMEQETFVAGAVNSIVPGGDGVEVYVENRGPTEFVVALREKEDAGRLWCAELDESGEARIPWEDFSTDCGPWGLDISAMGGAGGADAEPSSEDLYDPETPIAQILIVASGQIETSPTGVDFCLMNIAGY